MLVARQDANPGADEGDLRIELGIVAALAGAGRGAPARAGSYS
jgi:hypothetical protein